MTYFEEIKQFNQDEFDEWFKNQLKKSAEIVLDSVQSAIFTFNFPEDQKRAMEGVFALFRIFLIGKFKSIQNQTEQTNKIKLPSDVVVEAFDEAWEKQNGELPNIKAFEKMFMAINLKDVYKEITGEEYVI